MDDLMKKGFDFIKNIAEKISDACTGPESGTIFVSLVFYLVLLILTLVLLKVLFNVIRGFFPTKKKGKESVKNTVSVIPEVPSKPKSDQEKGLTALEEYDKQEYLEQLYLSFKKAEMDEDLAEKPQHITYTEPDQSAFLPLDNIVLSDSDKATLQDKISGKSLSELKGLLISTKEEDRKAKNKVEFLNNKLSQAYSSHEKINQELSAAVANHNQSVDKVISIKEELDRNITNLSGKYSKLLIDLSDIDNKKEEILTFLKEIEERIATISSELTSFDNSCDEKITAVKDRLVTEKTALDSLKDCYLTISKALSKADVEINNTRKDLEAAIKEQALNEEFISALEKEITALTKIENERLARLEAERLAREQEIKAKAEEARLRAEQEKQKAEAERIAREKERATIVSSAKGREEAAEEQALNEIKERIKQQARSSYTLNFDNLSSEQLDQMARAELKRKRKMAVEKTETISNTDPESIREEVVSEEESPGDSSNSENVNTESSSNDDSEGDLASSFEKLQQSWAAEREHKEAWKAEKEQREREAKRRKEKLLKELNEQEQTNNE